MSPMNAISSGKWDWESRGIEVWINPKLSPLELERAQEESRSFPHLAGHFWLMTSGTSAADGRPKWVALSKEAILVSASAVNRSLASDASDVWIHALPSFHVGGLGIWARAHLSRARVADIFAEVRKWDPVHFAKCANEAKGTLSALVPTQVYDLVQHGLRAPESLRAIVVGGGALSESLYAKARALGWPLLPSYGLTECASQVATASLESLQVLEFPELQLLSHIEAGTSDEGRIRIRSQSLLSGYWRAGEFWDPKDPEGGFTTEDQGEVSDPYLKIWGRGSDFVKINGESVDLSRLSAILEELRMAIPGVPDSAVLAIPDERAGHRIVMVAARGSGDFAMAQKKVEVLSKAFNSRVLPVERITRIEWPKDCLDQLPRSALGKLQREALLKRLASS